MYIGILQFLHFVNENIENGNIGKPWKCELCKIIGAGFLFLFSFDGVT